MSEYSLPEILSFSRLCVQSSINAVSIKLSRSKPSAKRDELAVSLQQREQVVSALSEAIDGIPKGDKLTIKAGLLIAIEDAEKSCRIYQGLWERLDKKRSPKLPRTYEPYYMQPWKKAKERLQFLNSYMLSISIEIATPAHH